MALPAIPMAVKTAATILSDEKSRTAALSLVVGIIVAVLLPIILLFSLLLLPMSGLTGGLSEAERSLIAGVRGQYGLDQYISDSEYLAAEALDFSGLSFTDGQTEVQYYNQLDSRWKDTIYGDSTIGRSGCGPTALSIAVSSLTDTAVDPVQMSTWAYENGYKAVGNGSYHSLIPNGAEHFGLTVDYATAQEPQKIVDALASGKLVIAIMGPGHFTTSGHFITLRGVTAEGEILVADPASHKRSEQRWGLEIILSEARVGAAAGGPFWLLSFGDGG